jgi:hypothetical protein
MNLFEGMDGKKAQTAVMLIAIGVSLRIALAGFPNIEPVLALSMIAGLVLGGWYALVVPLAMMVLSDWAIYALDYGDVFGWRIILGITFFTWTGMVLAGYAGRQVRPRFLFRLKGVAVFTGAALVMTLVYDLWTIPGYCLVFNQTLPVAIAGQVTFTVYHLLSTLIFAPLFGTIYVYVHEYDLPSMLALGSKAKAPEKNGRA